MARLSSPLAVSLALLSCLALISLASAQFNCGACNYCKCKSNCDTIDPCCKCNVAVANGGCKCDSNCNCISNPCTKCNVPVSQGGCKCDSNCNCVSSGTPPSGNVLYQGSGSGTYYYDVKTSCPQNPSGYAETDGYPYCTSFNSANYKTIRQYGTNNIVAIDDKVLSANRAQLCGKVIKVFHNGNPVAAPDGGDFFVWDGCQACEGGGRIDFSVSGLRDADPNACNAGVVSGISWQVLNQQAITFVP